MSALTKKHLIKPKGAQKKRTIAGKKTKDSLFFTQKGTTYKIPKSIAQKYIIEKKVINESSIPAAALFGDLESRFTRSGVLLKGLRVRENMTQIEFAKKIDVTQANLSSMENGRRPIGKEVAKRIGTIFNINYRYFLE